MSLIELLLALVIAILVVAVLFSTYHVVTVALTGQGERQRCDQAAVALEQLSRDLACTFARDDLSLIHI